MGNTRKGRGMVFLKGFLRRRVPTENRKPEEAG
jgi:hypothetical protein